MTAYIPDHLWAWIDWLWLPIGWFVVHPAQRWKTMAFILACLLTLRTQVELMESSGHGHGFLPLMESHVLTRGMITYGILIALFLLLAYLSPRTQGIIFFAASLSIYVLAFCISMVIMVL